MNNKQYEAAFLRRLHENTMLHSAVNHKTRTDTFYLANSLENSGPYLGFVSNDDYCFAVFHGSSTAVTLPFVRDFNKVHWVLSEEESYRFNIVHSFCYTNEHEQEMNIMLVLSPMGSLPKLL